MLGALGPKSRIAQYANVVNRMFTDLETKGTLRTAPETFNLAVHSCAHDETHAEFVRALQSQTPIWRLFPAKT